MSAERKIFMAHFQVKPFTKRTKSRRTLTKLLKEVTLGKVEVFKIIPIINALEGDAMFRVGVYIYTAEETSAVKKMTKILHRLNDKGVIDLDNAGHSGIYGGNDIEDDTIRIR